MKRSEPAYKRPLPGRPSNMIPYCASPGTDPVFARYGEGMVGGLALLGGLLGVPMTLGDETLTADETLEVGVSLFGRFVSRMASGWIRRAREDESAIHSWENEGGSTR